MTLWRPGVHGKAGVFSSGLVVAWSTDATHDGHPFHAEAAKIIGDPQGWPNVFMDITPDGYVDLSVGDADEHLAAKLRAIHPALRVRGPEDPSRYDFDFDDPELWDDE